MPLVISDVRRPAVSGLELLEEITRRYPDTAVLVLSGVSDVKTAVACLDTGALDYTAKPALLKEVRARVAKALEKRILAPLAPENPIVLRIVPVVHAFKGAFPDPSSLPLQA